MLSRRDYPFLSNVLTVLALCLFVFFTTYPKYLEILKEESPTVTYKYFFSKIAHPFNQLTTLQNDTHGSKVAFRLTVPLFTKAIGVSELWNGRGVVIIYLIQSTLLFPFLLYLYQLILRHTNDTTAWLFVIACSGSYLAKSFFWDYDFWFDAYAYFFLLMGLYTRSQVAMFLWLQLACWTDERAFIALSGVLLFHFLQENNFSISFDNFTSSRSNIDNRSFTVILAGALYLVLRWIFGILFNLTTPSGKDSAIGLEMVPFQFKNRLIGVFLSFEGLWLAFFVSAYLVWTKNRTSLILYLIGAAMFFQTVVAYCVYDISRSLAYMFPLFIIMWILLYKSNSSSAKIYFQISAIVCILIPTQYLIFFPRQIPWTLLSINELKDIAGHIYHRL